MQLRRSHFSTAGISKNPAHQKLYIHFFIDNSNANISLYTLSGPLAELHFSLEIKKDSISFQ